MLLFTNSILLQFVCSVIALLLHYFYLCTFAWTFVEGLHIYRMLTDMRNVNHGHMRFYYTIGWGIPAIITGNAIPAYFSGRTKLNELTTLQLTCSKTVPRVIFQVVGSLLPRRNCVKQATECGPQWNWKSRAMLSSLPVCCQPTHFWS